MADADVRQLPISAAAVDRRSADAEKARDLFDGQVLTLCSGFTGALHCFRLSEAVARARRNSVSVYEFQGIELRLWLGRRGQTTGRATGVNRPVSFPANACNPDFSGEGDVPSELGAGS
jgi:hypothetical protein